MTNQNLMNALAEQVRLNESLEKELKVTKQLCKERGRRINLLKENLKEAHSRKLKFFYVSDVCN